MRYTIRRHMRLRQQSLYDRLARPFSRPRTMGHPFSGKRRPPRRGRVKA